MAQGHLKLDQNELIDEKNRVQKIRETVPLMERSKLDFNPNFIRFKINFLIFLKETISQDFDPFCLLNKSAPLVLSEVPQNDFAFD